MRIVRSVGAVIIGYVVFAVSAVLLFQLTGKSSHAEQSGAFIALTIVYGMAFAALGGWIAARLAPARRMLHAGALAILIAFGAAMSLVMSPSKDASWSQWTALVLMAPCALLGGHLRARQLPA